MRPRTPRWKKPGAWIGLLFNFKPESEWSRINQHAADGPMRISPEMFNLLSACLQYSRESEGAFDITVGPLMKGWGFYKGTGHLPHTAEVAAALTKVGYRHIHLDRAARTVWFDRTGVEMDPGGIGKGYAVDRMVDVLRRNGVNIALVAGSRKQHLRNGSATQRGQGLARGYPQPVASRKDGGGGFPKGYVDVHLRQLRKVFPGGRQDFMPILWTRVRAIRRRGSVSVSVIAPRCRSARRGAQTVFREWPPVGGAAQAKGLSRVFLRRQDGSTMRVAPMTSRFLDACRRRSHRRTASLVYAAGRPLHEGVSPDPRKRHGILEICKRPDLAATVTLQTGRNARHLGAAIIFADLLLPVEPMGLKLRYEKGEGPADRQPRQEYRRCGFALHRRHGRSGLRGRGDSTSGPGAGRERPR